MRGSGYLPHAPRGWYCKYGPYSHGGSCPLVPRWWNVKWRWKMRDPR